MQTSRNNVLRCIFSTLLVGAIAPLSIDRAAAQVDVSGVIPETTAARVGLTRAWQGQVVMDASNDRLESITLHSHSTAGYVVFEIADKNGQQYVISEHDRNRLGREIGVEGAQQIADVTVERLISMGLEPKMEKRFIRQFCVMAQSRRGAIHVFDGETGRTMWTNHIGNSSDVTTAMGANDQYVAVASGLTLYLFNRTDGSLIWRHRLTAPAAAQPVLSDELVFAPLALGRIVSVGIENPNAPSWIHSSSGNLVAAPIVSDQSLVWSSDAGQTFVSRLRSPAVRFRIATRGPVLASAASRDAILYVASSDGYLVATHELSGDTQWTFGAGNPMRHAPAIVGDSAYVAADDAGLYRVDATTGARVWRADGADQFLAASERKVYAVDVNGRLMAIDRQSGATAGMLNTQVLSVHPVNQSNDRIVLATRNGLVQCLHEPSSPRPRSHDDAGAKKESKNADREETEEAGEDEPAPGVEGADLFQDQD